MLVNPPPKFRKARQPKAAVGLQLLSATYVWGSSLTLNFNLPVSIAAIVVSDILVNDPVEQECQFSGRIGTAVLVNPTTVRMQLTYVQDLDPGTITTLDVTSGNGIATSDGLLHFAGVSGVVIQSVST